MTGRAGLGALYGRLRSAGVEAGDPDELQLKKQVLLFACGLMIAGSAIWLSIYWLLGLPLPATLPVAFQLLSTINSSTGHLCLSCFQYPGERAHSSPLHASLLKVSNMSFSASIISLSSGLISISPPTAPSAKASTVILRSEICCTSF